MKVAVISSVVALLGLGFAYMIYGKRTASDPLVAKLGGFYTVLQNKFYFDIVYGWYVDNIQQNMALFLARFEKEIIDRACLSAALPTWPVPAAKTFVIYKMALFSPMP